MSMIYGRNHGIRHDLLTQSAKQSFACGLGDAFAGKYRGMAQLTWIEGPA